MEDILLTVLIGLVVCWIYYFNTELSLQNRKLRIMEDKLEMKRRKLRYKEEKRRQKKNKPHII